MLINRYSESYITIIFIYFLSLLFYCMLYIFIKMAYTIALNESVKNILNILKKLHF